VAGTLLLAQVVYSSLKLTPKALVKMHLNLTSMLKLRLLSRTRLLINHQVDQLLLIRKTKAHKGVQEA